MAGPAEQGELPRARAYYLCDIEVAPYLHDIYLRVAGIHIAKGDRKRAECTLKKEHDRAWTGSNQDRYRAKLVALGEC